MRRRKPGFTLIELLIVIAVISILIGLLVMGVGKMSRSMKAKATAADLENIQSFFDEMNAHAGMNTTPVNWLWRNQAVAGGTASAGTVGGINVNFWKVPYTVSFTPGVVVSDAFSAEGSMADNDGSGMELLRNGSKAVLNTQLAMRILLSYPGNKAAVAKLPADRLFIPNWVYGSIAASGADGLSGTGDEAADLSGVVVYAVNNCVKYNGATYRCVTANVAALASTAPVTPAPVSPATVYWQPDSDPTPLILDAWGNPLIFVPATGLINVYTGIKNASDPTSTITALPSTPSTSISAIVPSVYNRAIKQPIQSPDSRPFFVSAGPDGDLTTGDDNIYSFSK